VSSLTSAFSFRPTDNLTLPSMSTTTMQNFLGGDGDDGLLPEFGSDDDFDGYVFGECRL